MENKFRNEKRINLAGKEILLRPTFENLANMETKMGGIAYLAWKYGKGVDMTKPNAVASAAALPPISDCAQIFYFNQIPPDGEKPIDIETMLDLCLQEGLKVTTVALEFLMGVASGNKNAPAPSEAQKKS